MRDLCEPLLGGARGDRNRRHPRVVTSTSWSKNCSDIGKRPRQSRERLPAPREQPPLLCYLGRTCRFPAVQGALGTKSRGPGKMPPPRPPPSNPPLRGLLLRSLLLRSRFPAVPGALGSRTGEPGKLPPPRHPPSKPLLQNRNRTEVRVTILETMGPLKGFEFTESTHALRFAPCVFVGVSKSRSKSKPKQASALRNTLLHMRRTKTKPTTGLQSMCCPVLDHFGSWGAG